MKIKLGCKIILCNIVTILSSIVVSLPIKLIIKFILDLGVYLLKSENHIGSVSRHVYVFSLIKNLFLTICILDKY